MDIPWPPGLTADGRTRRLTVDWGTDDPELAELLRWAEALPKHSALHCEVMAGLHQFMARLYLQDAARAADRERERRRRRT